MGLKISTLDSLPERTDRRYFVYFLDYGWSDEFTDVLYRNFDQTAARLAGIEGVVAQGLDRHHFADQVLSWHNINGADAGDLLPAILVTEKHPNSFRNRPSEAWERDEHGLNRYDGAVLIPLKEVCPKPSDIVPIIENILNGIREGLRVDDFELVGTVGKDKPEIFLLQPNLYGVGVDLKALWKKGKEQVLQRQRDRSSE